MKYSIVINQVGIVKAGLLGITDFSDWAIIAYIKDLFAHPKSVKLPYKGELFVWINYSHIMEEMPMLGISTKNPLTDRFKKLKKLSLIKTVKIEDNTIYARLTENCMDVFSYREDAVKDAQNTPPVNPNSDRVSIQTPTGGINPNSDSTSSISNQIEYNSSIVVNGSSDRLGKPKQQQLNNDDFIAAIKNNPAYKGIDIDKELSKMDAWLTLPKARGRKKTKQFILNWLNKIDIAVDSTQRRVLPI